MTTTEQQAGATERAAVERLAHFIGWRAERVPQNYPYEAETSWGKIGFWRSPKGRIFKVLEWNPFTNPADERELLTAVQERWGRPALEEWGAAAVRRWEAFNTRVDPMNSSALVLAYLAPGDIARAVDAVLREYGG